jgi:hypothetical protein
MEALDPERGENDVSTSTGGIDDSLEGGIHIEGRFSLSVREMLLWPSVSDSLLSDTALGADPAFAPPVL